MPKGIAATLRQCIEALRIAAMRTADCSNGPIAAILQQYCGNAAAIVVLQQHCGNAHCKVLLQYCGNRGHCGNVFWYCSNTPIFSRCFRTWNASATRRIDLCMYQSIVFREDVYLRPFLYSTNRREGIESDKT